MRNANRILYHCTTTEGFVGIQEDLVIKPGPSGRIWLCQSSALNWTIQHLWKRGKLVKVILGVDTSRAIQWLPLKGVWFLTDETPSWFYVAPIQQGSYPLNVGGREKR